MRLRSLPPPQFAFINRQARTAIPRILILLMRYKGARSVPDSLGLSV